MFCKQIVLSPSIYNLFIYFLKALPGRKRWSGGPHAARGPHVVHPWYILCDSTADDIISKINTAVSPEFTHVVK